MYQIDHLPLDLENSLRGLFRIVLLVQLCKVVFKGSYELIHGGRVTYTFDLFFVFIVADFRKCL
jgi:hypothetical protein